jgi:hypothetical protein
MELYGLADLSCVWIMAEVIEVSHSTSILE